MNSKTVFLTLFILGIFLAGLQSKAISAADSNEAKQQDHKMPKIKPPAEFEQIKQLAGIWEGTQETPEGKKQVIVEYQTTSAGTAVIEKLFPGTKEEMLSIYHGDNNQIMMTHYCAFGNQPRMRVTKIGDPGSLKFVYFDGGSISSAEEPHMHQLTLSFINKDQLSHEWVFFENGKSSHVAKFDLRRMK